jgi:hypothetical protein
MHPVEQLENALAGAVAMSGRTARIFSTIWAPTGRVGSKLLPGSAPM